MPEAANTTPAEAPAAEEAQEQTAEKKYTQADIDRIIGERIAGVRSKYADYDDLKVRAAKADELEAAQLSEVERAVKRAEQAEADLKAEQERVAQAELAALKLRVGTEKGLPSALIDRLSGNDAESIAADADAILAALPKPQAPAGGANPPADDDEVDAILATIRKGAGLK